MGIMGELFPGQKLGSEAGGDSDGQDHPRVDLDLSAGVIRITPVAEQPASAPDAPETDET
ncbi:hypothetical protein [Nocardia camponoti]|uniref:Uncharacterized protein n=1 Tax=Nocardia camponoti TaxID=1616106 RepID=A0A917Q7N0_9NOCA|nr:hypothetical protein [Nocardia camponoti]GGK34576.1 hypothetical protein GCM10011591_02770 [Nocardia camponoti]